MFAEKEKEEKKKCTSAANNLTERATSHTAELHELEEWA